MQHYCKFQILWDICEIKVKSPRRFLRARGWQLFAAQEQFQDAESWKLKYDVHNLYAKFDPQEFEHAKRFYPRWTGRRDKVRGLQMRVVVVLK
jgi:hypothetical protein